MADIENAIAACRFQGISLPKTAEQLGLKLSYVNKICKKINGMDIKMEGYIVRREIVCKEQDLQQEKDWYNKKLKGYRNGLEV